MFSHAHEDHIGDAPELVKLYPQIKITSIYDAQEKILSKGVPKANFIGMNKGSCGMSLIAVA